MGGRDGSRGYLYQGIASVIKALSDSDWDQIFVECPSENDKIDIGLKRNDALVRSIQVKSSINLFTKPDLISWLKDLTSDSPSADYELFFIGNCDRNANEIVKKLKQFHEGGMQDTDLLSELDPTYLNAFHTHITIVPFDIDSLTKISIAHLFEYIGVRGFEKLTYDCLDFIVSAMINDHMSIATTQDGCSREEFDERLNKRIQLLTKEYVQKRNNIGIRSFSRGSETMEEETSALLCLLDRFEDRFLHESHDWDNDVFPIVRDFLTQSTEQSGAYALLLNTHSTIAFAAGKVLDSISGINVVPRQKTNTGIVLWEVDTRSEEQYQDWSVEYVELDHEHTEVALVISPTRNIKEDVVEYIKSEALPIGKIIHCSLSRATGHSIVDGTHCSRLANAIYPIAKNRTLNERKEMLHVFASVPNAFMFYLGQNSRGLGKLRIYDYDFEQRNCCTYFPTMTFM